MKALKFLLVGLVFTAAVVAPLVTHLRGETARRARNALLRQQALDAERLAVENGLFSNIVARARTPQSLSGTQLSELLRLRNEVTQLRSMLNETNRLGREIVQLRDGLDALQAEKENSEDSATALLDAQRELRTARLAKLREWVADRPSEMIPELQFLSEESWMKSSEWTRVTDEEYASWMSSQRSNAEMKFANSAFKALKRYAAANNGDFPADLSKLKPYFESPIADAILERYHIVPAKSLPLTFLQETGRDWVVTQKVPVNRMYDSRMAISATDNRMTIAEGRWADVP